MKFCGHCVFWSQSGDGTVCLNILCKVDMLKISINFINE